MTNCQPSGHRLALDQIPERDPRGAQPSGRRAASPDWILGDDGWLSSCAGSRFSEAIDF